MQTAIDAINSASNIIISAHARPDGDALGSTVGLARLLNQAGKNARVVGLRPYAKKYEYLEAACAVTDPDEKWFKDADLFIACDCGAFDRLPEFSSIAHSKMKVLNIDHHDSNTNFGDVNWVEPHASSTGEMIYLLASEMNLNIDALSATALWTAIVTDTGRFSYANTTADVLDIAASLVRCGVEPPFVEKQVYQSRTASELMLMQKATASLEILEGGKLALVKLSSADFEECGCGPQDASEVVNIPRSIAGVEASIFFYELTESNEVKASFRTAPPYDASKLCGIFGGGGHHRAAGCSIKGCLSDVIAQVLDTVKKEWF